MRMILDLLLPREVAFFKYLNQQADNFYEACKLFNEMVFKWNKLSDSKIKERVNLIKACEKKGDKIERKIFEELEKTFITPLDREDIHDIAARVDDALDFLNGISQKLVIYRVENLPANIVRFSKIILKVASELKKLVKSLEGKNSTQKILDAMHNLEKDADDLYHESIAELFKTSNAIEIIKFKEIYENLENTVNSIDQISSLVRGILIKRG